ncbi:MAG: hypothetical protein U9Q63_03390 [Patescibacteria group bacterium]|nr:hypothetical protein [Patescibacteria group bacterium]
MHSILITGANQQKRLEKANQSAKTIIKKNLDVRILKPDPSITIKQVRDIEIFLSKKPYKNNKNIVLIINSEKLTIPAQNALLKTLEEPPKNSLIILLTKNQNQLLETITSRCQIIQLKNQTKLSKDTRLAQKTIYNQLVKSSIPKRIGLISTYAANKKEAIQFCKNQILFLKPNIINHHQLIKKLTLSINRLNANLNPKLALESLFFSY